MKPLLAPLLAAALLIAPGCLSSNDEPSKPPADKPGANVTRTETVYLLGAPDTTLVAPNGTADIAAALFSTTPTGDVGTTWTYEFNNNATITGGSMTVYVHVDETTTHQGVQGATCTWRLFMAFDGTDAFPGNTEPCVAAAPGPLSGDITVTFTFTLSKQKVNAKDSVDINFKSFTSSTQAHPTLKLLTGSKDHAAKITFKGANETLPA